MRDTLCIVGIDPGRTTGYAIMLNGRLVDTAQVDRQDVIAYLEAYLTTTLETHPGIEVIIACERFTIGHQTSRLSQQPAALEVIGLVRDLAQRLHVRFELQSPGDAKKVGSRETLKKLGWYVASTDHANDAKSHLLLALLRRKPDAFAGMIGL